MIRHALPSCTVTATSGSVHGATTRSCLIAPPSFSLLVAAGFLRAGSDAIDLAAIALPTDKNLRAAATTQKRPARHFIGTVRHITPQPSADSGLPPAPSRSSMPPCSGQSRPSPSGGREDAASLDRPCARRLRDSAVGTEECSRRGPNQRMDPRERQRDAHAQSAAPTIPSTPSALDHDTISGKTLKRQSGAPSRMITIPGTSDHHHLEFVITIVWND